MVGAQAARAHPNQRLKGIEMRFAKRTSASDVASAEGAGLARFGAAPQTNMPHVRSLTVSDGR
jgi:hypothetical protein